ncbi:MAG TPA: DEAD/DEAH box helicase [Myxococcales bacterium]|nr:DEAD/DEAH box helicase [Myxococcales bacterium]
MSRNGEITQVLGQWLSNPQRKESITEARYVEAVEGRYQDLPKVLNPALKQALQNQGIKQLYSHQSQAIDAACSGQNTMLVTPTASGKSLCFHLPVLNDLMENPNGRALYLFPTKALTQDQYASLHQLIEQCESEIKTFTFDGDTPADARRAVREMGQIVLTNPDMLHSGVLPHHTRWLKLFRNLRWVIIDEIHSYKGVFGSHLANVIRRLKRICAFHGSSPTFVLASATIANAREFGERLLEDTMTIVDESGAPQAAKHMVFVNPKIVNRQLGIRRSALKTARDFARDLLRRKIPTIIFVQSRLNVEILVKYLRQDMKAQHDNPELVQGYRGGYLPTHRRGIEAGLRAGKIQCVVATNALELGIDIGDLSACVIVGYPGSIASVWQQSGRAGRRNGESLTVMVGRSTALDQYVVETPDYFFGRSPEEVRIDPDNVFILVDHVKCAAFELPFEEGERFGTMSSVGTNEVLEHLQRHGVLHKAGKLFHWMDRSFPANHISLRRVHSENFVVIDIHGNPDGTAKVIAEVDFHSAHTTLHEHAIYNLDGAQYQVERLDYDDHKAYVQRVDADYFTYAHSHFRVQVLATDGHAGHASHGEVLVGLKVVGFKKVKFNTHENIGYGEVHLPEVEMHTTATWITVPETTINQFGREAIVDALRGLGRAIHTMATLRMMCASRDIGLTVDEPDDSGPRLYLYDNFPGGIGFGERLFELTRPLLAGAAELIAHCSCASGCPGCIGAHRTDNDNTKELAGKLVQALLKRPALNTINEVANP